ncbi:MAG: hypothetical protein JXR95_02990 [Deltaproteobacteria bacterium]|nr:hypothetical protein [Deltaproteobacteria bacterium]
MKTCVFASMILLLTVSCSGKKETTSSGETEKKSTTKKFVPMNYAQGDDMITVSPPNLKDLQRRKKQVSKRAKGKRFKVLNGTVSRLPKFPFQADIVVPGHFSGVKTIEYAAISSSKVEFVSADGKRVASSQGVATPKFAIAINSAVPNYQYLVVASGRGRKTRNAPIVLTVYSVKDGKVSLTTTMNITTSRNDISSLEPRDGGGFVVGYYVTKYEVQVSEFLPPFKKEIKIKVMKMAGSLNSIISKKHQLLMVGRLYGDTPGSPGDAWIMESGKMPEKIPTTRGVRSITTADVDKNGQYEIYMGDGWDKNYGQIARALFTKVERNSSGKLVSTKIGELSEDYAIMQIEKCHMKGSENPVFVLKGNNTIQIAVWKNKWEITKIADLTSYEKLFCADINDDGTDEIVISKPYPAVITLGKK